MGVLDSIKQKLGFDEDYIEDDYEYNDNEEDSNLEEEVSNGGEAPIQMRKDSLHGDRTYDYESPYGSGAHAGAVVRKPRTPDLDRASAAAGSRVRDVAVAPASVVPMSPQTLIHNSRPGSFNECGIIADRYKRGQPIIIDLAGIEGDERRRFIDFISGLVYGLDGEISRLAECVFLITPSGVSLSEADKTRVFSRY